MPDWIFYQEKSNLSDMGSGIPILILLKSPLAFRRQIALFPS